MVNCDLRKGEGRKHKYNNNYTQSRRKQLGGFLSDL